MEKCKEISCPNEAVVGWGTPPQWLCMAHYEGHLRAVRQTIDRLLAAEGT